MWALPKKPQPAAHGEGADESELEVGAALPSADAMRSGKKVIARRTPWAHGFEAFAVELRNSFCKIYQMYSCTKCLEGPEKPRTRKS